MIPDWAKEKQGWIVKVYGLDSDTDAATIAVVEELTRGIAVALPGELADRVRSEPGDRLQHHQAMGRGVGDMTVLQAVILAAWIVAVGVGIGLILVLAIDAVIETVRSRRRDRL
jgi:hypothetical protein